MEGVAPRPVRRRTLRARRLGRRLPRQMARPGSNRRFQGYRVHRRYWASRPSGQALSLGQGSSREFLYRGGTQGDAPAGLLGVKEGV